MNFDRATCKSTCKWLVVASLGTAALLMANAAQAQNQGVYWSLGLSSPGVQVGIGNAQPVFVQPIQRVIVVPQQPVYLQPRRVTTRVITRDIPQVITPVTPQCTVGQRWPTLLWWPTLR